MDIDREKAEEIADKARNALGDFCVNECGGYCCRKGYLLLSNSEVDIVVKDRSGFLEKGYLKEIGGGKFSLFLGNPDGCPNLDGSKCLIHDNPKRPLACREFPIFLSGDMLRVSKRCFGAGNNALYPFIRELVAMGYRVV